MGKEYGSVALETVINIKANMLMTKNRDMEFSLGLLAIYIKETMNLMLEMASGKCTGVTEAFIKDNGETVFSMGKVKSMCQDKGTKKECFKTTF